MQRHRRLALAVMLILPFLLVALTLEAEQNNYVVDAGQLASLPVPVANNAVTSLRSGDTQYVITFAGLGSGREHSDTHARTFLWSDENGQWTEKPAVPGDIGRLAATAASVGELAYVFGGYTIADDGAETSTPFVHSFDPQTSEFTELSPMPVPVDDAVSVTYANRYIYLISGWHDLGNVNLVQQYDTKTDTWAQATPIPGNSLFGHAGGIVGRKMAYCDGVTVRANPNAARSFVASNECFVGVIDEKDSRRIDWRPIAPHSGLPRYRMAAAGIPSWNSVLFVGGSENPYNYNGIGYDGNPSEPSRSALLLDLETLAWLKIEHDGVASMDHRGLVPYHDGWITVGGMLSGQTVTDGVVSYSLRAIP